ncbi:MAG: hypothetical protein ACI4DP_12735 [Candidatus Ornithomonoglobus sp.]
MEKYIAPEMEVVEFEAADVITTSLVFCSSDVPDDDNDLIL